MTIQPGDQIPSVEVKLVTSQGVSDATSDEILGNGTVVFFSVPGAFTPTCHLNHLPGYLENYDAILAKGVDTIAVVAVNDQFVMQAWARFTGGEGKLLFLADGSGDFATAAGLDLDLAKAGLGLRLKRFSAIVEDGTVTALNIEDAPGMVANSGAATILEQL